MMSIKSHVLTALGAGVVGFVGGAMAGASIQSMLDEMKRNKAIAALGGISLEDKKETEKLYESVLDALKKNLDDTGVEGLSEEVLSYAKGLCLPQIVEGQTFAQIPSLRNGLKDPEDILGTRKAAFEYFDAYYEAKGNTTDKYVAQVRILDNLHSLLLSYIDIAKKQPGEANAKVLQKLGQALKTLHENFNVAIAGTRDVEFLKHFSDTKREELARKLKDEDDKIIQEAIAEQKQITLVESCNQSISNTIDTAGSVGEFFLRTLDANASATSTDLVIAKMEKREVERSVTGPNKLAESPIGVVVKHHIEHTARFKREEVADKNNSFNERFKKGALSLSPLVKTGEGGIREDRLPKFMQTHLLDGSDIKVKDAVLTEIAKIMNYLNIAIALEEDLKNKIDSFGSKGIVSTGEFEFRRALIETFYQQAMNDFKKIAKENPYYQEFFDKVSQAQFIKDHKAQMQTKDKNAAIVVSAKGRKLKDYLPENVQNVPNIIQIGVLEDVASKDEKVTRSQQEIVKYVSERQKDNAPNISPIMLNSDQFIINMALICANDEKIKDNIITNLASAKEKLQGDNQKIFEKRFNLLVERIDELIVIKAGIDEIRSIIPKIIKDDEEEVNFFAMFDFSKLKNMQDFITMKTDLAKLRAAAERTKNDDYTKEEQKIAENLIFAIDSLSSKLLKFASRFQEITPNQVELFAAQGKISQLEAELENLRSVYSQNTSGIEEASEMERNSHREHVAALEKSLNEATAHYDQMLLAAGKLAEEAQKTHDLEKETLTQLLESEETKSASLEERLNDNQSEIEALQLNVKSLKDENAQQILTNIKLQQKNTENENLIVTILDQYKADIDGLTADMEEIKVSLDNMNTKISEQLDNTSQETLNKGTIQEIKDILEKNVENLKVKIAGMQERLKKLGNSIPENSTAIKIKFDEVNGLLDEQHHSLEESSKRLKDVSEQLEKAIKIIEALKQKLAQEAEKSRQVQEKLQQELIRQQELTMELEKQKAQLINKLAAERLDSVKEVAEKASASAFAAANTVKVMKEAADKAVSAFQEAKEKLTDAKKAVETATQKWNTLAGKKQSNPEEYLLEMLKISGTDVKENIQNLFKDPKLVGEIFQMLEQAKKHPNNQDLQIYAKGVQGIVKFVGQNFTEDNLKNCFKELGGANDKKPDNSKLTAVSQLSGILGDYHELLDKTPKAESGKNPLKNISRAAGDEVDVKRNPGWFFGHREWGKEYQYIPQASLGEKDKKPAVSSSTSIVGRLKKVKGDHEIELKKLDEMVSEANLTVKSEENKKTIAEEKLKKVESKAKTAETEAQEAKTKVSEYSKTNPFVDMTDKENRQEQTDTKSSTNPFDAETPTSTSNPFGK